MEEKNQKDGWQHQGNCPFTCFILIQPSGGSIYQEAGKRKKKMHSLADNKQVLKKNRLWIECQVYGTGEGVALIKTAGFW